MLERTPKAVIFDLDGVLLDTEPLYTQATQEIVSRYGKRFDWELKRQTMGGDAKMGAALVVETLELPLTPEEYLAERHSLLQQLFVDAQPMPGVEQWIAELQGRGLPVAVGTSSVSELCELKWKKHNWLSSLEPKVCGDDPEVERRKPAPDIFLVAAKRLQMAPSDCVVFEDSPAGVKAAKTAGMQVIALRAPQLERSYLQAADIIVDAYQELSLARLGL